MTNTYVYSILKIFKFTNIVLRPLYQVILILWKTILHFTNYKISNFGVIIQLKKATLCLA